MPSGSFDDLSRAPDFHRAVWAAASDLRGAVLGQPFGPEYEVFKVAGKVFAMTTEVQGVAVATLKCEPGYAAALREEYPSVTVGYHMNRRHWISVAPGPGISRELVEELVSNSYLLVVAGLPRRLRPELQS